MKHLNNEDVETFNKIRVACMDVPFKRADVMDKLRMLKLPDPQNLIPILTERGILIKEGPNRHDVLYKFTKEPVYGQLLDNCISILREKQKQYCKNYAAKKRLRKETGREHITPIDEEYCINFLKARGYKIKKPVTKWEEC